MSGMLGSLCTHYYRLKMKHQKHDDRYRELLENVLKFDGNVKVSELDAILESNRRALKEFDKSIVAFEKIKEIERDIVRLMRGLGIRPRWFMVGEISGELLYEVWYDDEDNVYIAKVKDIEPEPVNPNIITIKMAPAIDDPLFEANEDDEDEDDDEKKTPGYEQITDAQEQILKYVNGLDV